MTEPRDADTLGQPSTPADGPDLSALGDDQDQDAVGRIGASTEEQIADARDGDPAPDAISDAEAAKIARTIPVNANVITLSTPPDNGGRSFGVPAELESGEGILGSTSDHRPVAGSETKEEAKVNVYTTNLGRRIVVFEDGQVDYESADEPAPDAEG